MKDREFEKTVDSTKLSGRLKGVDMLKPEKTATDEYMFIYIHLHLPFCVQFCFFISKKLQRTQTGFKKNRIGQGGDMGHAGGFNRLELI